MYKSPADGVSFSRGLWRECTWAVIPGRDRCTHISVSKAYPWERTVQGLYIVFWIFMLMTAIMFTAAMPAALRRGSSNALAKVAGLLSLFSGFLGLIVISVFCAYTPDGGDGVSSGARASASASEPAAPECLPRCPALQTTRRATCTGASASSPQPGRWPCF